MNSNKEDRVKFHVVLKFTQLSQVAFKAVTTSFLVFYNLRYGVCTHPYSYASWTIVYLIFFINLRPGKFSKLTRSNFFWKIKITLILGNKNVWRFLKKISFLFLIISSEDSIWCLFPHADPTVTESSCLRYSIIFLINQILRFFIRRCLQKGWMNCFDTGT